MYGNPYTSGLGYNPMAQPAAQQNPFAQYFGNLFQPQPFKVPQVSGKAGANAFEMPASSEILLMDENDPIVWYVKTDDGGTKTITGLDISIHEDEDTKKMVSLEERVAKLEEEMRRKHHEPDYVDVTFDE